MFPLPPPQTHHLSSLLLISRLTSLPPFVITTLCFAAVDSKKCYATGRGVQPKGVRVADDAVFKVHTQGAGEGELKVQVNFFERKM